MSVKFYKRLIVVVYTLILLMPTVVLGIIAFDYKSSLSESDDRLASYSDSIVVKQTKIGKSGVMEVYAPEGKKKSLVIVQHAINTNRRDVIKAACKFAEAGFFVVAPDLYAHGDRKKTDARELAMQGAVYTSQSYDLIVEHYKKSSKCNTDKFGIVGFSLGGMVAYHYATYGTYKPTVIAPCIATPDWEDLEDTYLADTIIPTGDNSMEGDDEKKKNGKSVLEENSPMNNYLNMKDVHILMQNGLEDKIISADGAINLSELLSEAGADITLVMHESQGHIVPDENIDLIMDFLVKNLK